MKTRIKNESIIDYYTYLIAKKFKFPMTGNIIERLYYERDLIIQRINKNRHDKNYRDNKNLEKWITAIEQAINVRRGDCTEEDFANAVIDCLPINQRRVLKTL